MYKRKERKNCTSIVQFPGHDTLQEKEFRMFQSPKPNKCIITPPLQRVRVPEHKDKEEKNPKTESQEPTQGADDTQHKQNQIMHGIAATYSQ